MLMLARNSDLNGVLQSVREAEDRFNREFQYPWVFLNEEEFSDEFKTYVHSLTLSQSCKILTKYRRVGNLISGEVKFGVIPHDHWYQPDWIDEDKAKKGRQELVRNKVIYGGAFLL